MTQQKKPATPKSGKPTKSDPHAPKPVMSQVKKSMALPIKDKPVVLAKPKVVEEVTYAREYWNGDSRDGVLVNGDGYHYYRMTKAGKILEAYEFYETDDGAEFASPLPEMLNINWLLDLGFEDFEALDAIKEFDFERVKGLSNGIPQD